MIAHGDDENKGARAGLVEDRQHPAGEFGIGEIGRPARAAQAFAAEKRIEAERRHGPVAVKKAAVERMQAKGAIALGAQPPGERGDRRPGKGVIGVEAVVAEILIGDAGQHRKFGAHRIGAPAGDIEPSEGRALIHTSVEARQQVFGHARRGPARVEERFALHQDQRHIGGGAPARADA